MSENPSRLQLPAHLRDIIELDPENTSPEDVVGRLVCTCGNKKLATEYVGEVVQDPEFGTLIRARDDGDRSGVRIIAHCDECKSEHMVFDSGLHGWDAMINELGTEPDTGSRWPPFAPDGPVEMFKCPSCAACLFEVDVGIKGESYTDACDEVSTLTVDQWANGFGWITVNLSCTECKWTGEVFSYETR